MVRTPRSAFDGIDRLIVDGSNLLYRIGPRRARGAVATSAEGQVDQSPAGAAPQAAIIGRLRAVVPGAVTIDLVFDGIGHGIRGRVAERMFVRYAGRRTADDLILDLAEPPAGATSAGVLVVTSDRDLRSRLESRGARTLPGAWLTDRLDLPRLAAPAPGNRRPPAGIGAPPRGGQSGDAGDERPGWKPGRGATAKTGPARRVARHRRHPRHPG
jgi:hypothetical protein